jgi:hypothetical protein
MPSSQAARAFDAMKADLLRGFPGQFALVCGPRLMGVYESLDDALAATSRLFDDDDLPPGVPILISEIAARASVRVVATPYRRVTSPRAGGSQFPPAPRSP